jgi:hypothetical protein
VCSAQYGSFLVFLGFICYYYYYYHHHHHHRRRRRRRRRHLINFIIVRYGCLSQAFLPSTSLEPAVIPTAQASSFTLQYFPYYV